MRLITTNAGLVNQLTRLIDSYPHMAFAVAWASASTPIFHRLLKARRCITTSVIGTHFYQTHPDVLEAFVGSDQVRFVFQPAGIFHPKLYIFWTAKHWEALVGSANLTSGAFGNNSEAVVLLGNRDVGSAKLKRDIDGCLRKYWSIATVATPKTVQAYRSVWERQQPVLRRLGGHYGRTKSRKAPVESSVMSMSWSDFVSAVRSDRYHGFKERCDLLSLVRSAFAKHRDFTSMELGLRQTIAGIPTRFDPRWGWFGSMKGVGYFQKAVNTNDPHLSRALDRIPLVGIVTRSQFEAFLAEFIKAFPHGRHGVATASRLLALKRPDQFVCVDSKNRKELCLNFGIPQGINYEGYWHEIAERIQDSPWWNSSRPESAEEAMIWDGRAAMLDGIFYRQ